MTLTSKETLTGKDILQIDATVITGLLIFMTISLVSEPALALLGYSYRGLSFLYTALMLFPFVLSAAIILQKEEYDMIKRSVQITRARWITLIGFWQLLVLVFVLGISPSLAPLLVPYLR